MSFLSKRIVGLIVVGALGGIALLFLLQGRNNLPPAPKPVSEQPPVSRSAQNSSLSPSKGSEGSLFQDRPSQGPASSYQETSANDMLDRAQELVSQITSGGPEPTGTAPQPSQVPQPTPSPYSPPAILSSPAPALPHITASSSRDIDAYVFATLNPPYYINLLSLLQDDMIATNVMSKEEWIPLTSQENIVAFLLKMIDYLRANGTISSDDYARFRVSIPDYYLSLKRQEETDLRRQLQGSQSPLSSNQPPADPLNRHSVYVGPHRLTGQEDPLITLLIRVGLIRSLTIAFNDLLHINSASAQVVDCFKPGGIPVTPGPNLWAPCCNCRAGPKPIGCLNAVCSTWPAAIWDPMTGVCGCG